MNRTRAKQIVIRLSDQEYQKLKTRVKQSGKSQQEYLTAAIFEAQIVNLDGLKAIASELKRQGNNLNQIARAANIGRLNLSTIEIEKTLKEVQEIWQSLKPFLRERA